MNVLVVCPNCVGDAVMATPALRALRRGFAGARVVGLMRPVIADVLTGLDYFDACHAWNPRSPSRSERTWPVIKALRHERIDISVLLPNSLRSAVLAWLSGARRRIGYRRDGRGWLLTDGLTPLKIGGRFVATPIIDYYVQLACYLGCPRDSYRLSLTTTRADEHAAEAVWRAGGLHDAERVVVLNPGAAYGMAKCWPTEHFAALARKMACWPGTRVLVLCGPSERTLARTIVERADHPGVHSLADFPVSIGLSKACVRRCDLMITTDSGPRHFAAAFDVPVVTLFGPTHIEWSETYFDKSLHLQKQVPCGPCQLRECPLDHRCMRELEPEQVLQAALELMQRYPRAVQPLRRSA
jgi:heptosyltransferase-2